MLGGNRRSRHHPMHATQNWGRRLIMHDAQPLIHREAQAILPAPAELKSGRGNLRWKPVIMGLGLIVLIGGLGTYAFDPWNWRAHDRPPTMAEKLEEARKALEDRDFDLAMQDLRQC